MTKYPALHTLRPGAMAIYECFVREHLLPAFGKLPTAAITPETVEDFIECKRAPGGSTRFEGKGLGDNSIRSGLQVLRLILMRALRQKLVLSNPMDLVEFRGALTSSRR